MILGLLASTLILSPLYRHAFAAPFLLFLLVFLFSSLYIAALFGYLAFFHLSSCRYYVYDFLTLDTVDCF